MQQIKYDDPQGATLDLVRPVTRHIDFKMPADYQGPTLPAVSQQVIFYREANVDDNGEKTFTSWHADDPFWTIYRAPQLTGLRPAPAEVPSQDVTVDTPGEQVTITYQPDEQTTDDGNSVPADPDAGDTSTAETEPTGESQPSQETEKATAKTKASSHEVPPVSATTDFLANFKKQKPNLLAQDNETPAKPTLPEVKLNLPNIDSLVAQSQTAPQPVKRPFVKPLLIPRQILPVPFADQYQHLLQDPEAATLLNRILTIGRIYRKDQHQMETELFTNVQED